MRKNKRKHNQKPLAIYGAAPLKSRLIHLIPLPLFAFALAFTIDVAIRNSLADWISVVFLSLMLYAFSFVTWGTLQEFKGKRLLFFDTGIEAHIMGVRCFAHWDELVQFSWKRCEGKNHWGILIDEPISKSKSLLSKIFLYSDLFEGIIPLDFFERIPHTRISHRQIDLERFKKTPLGRDLYTYAPHLFDEAETKIKHPSA